MSDLSSFEESIELKKITSPKCTEYLFAGMKAQWDGGGGRPPMGESTDGRAIVLGPIRPQCVGDWI